MPTGMPRITMQRAKVGIAPNKPKSPSKSVCIVQSPFSLTLTQNYFSVIGAWQNGKNLAMASWANTEAADAFKPITTVLISVARVSPDRTNSMPTKAKIQRITEIIGAQSAYFSHNLVNLRLNKVLSRNMTIAPTIICGSWAKNSSITMLLR